MIFKLCLLVSTIFSLAFSSPLQQAEIKECRQMVAETVKVLKCVDSLTNNTIADCHNRFLSNLTDLKWPEYWMQNNCGDMPLEHWEPFKKVEKCIKTAFPNLHSVAKPCIISELGAHRLD